MIWLSDTSNSIWCCCAAYSLPGAYRSVRKWTRWLTEPTQSRFSSGNSRIYGPSTSISTAIRTLGELPHTAFRVFSSLGQYRSIHDIFWLFCPHKNGVKWGFSSNHFSRNPHFARFKCFFSSALICRKNCTLGRTLDRTKQLQAFVAIHEGGRFFTRQNLFMRCF